MAVTPFTVIPSRLRPSTFSADMDQFLSELDEKMGQVASVEQSLQLVATTGTSTTALTVGTGSRTLTTQAGKAWVVGSFVYLVYPPDASNLMYGQVTAYNALTGALTVNVTHALGGGNLGSWVIGLSVPMDGAPVFSGDVTAQGFYLDALAYFALSGGNPVLKFDDTDYVSYDRADDTFRVRILNVERMRITANGPERSNDATTADGLVRKSQMDTATQQATTSTRGTVTLADGTEARAEASKPLTHAALRKVLVAENDAPIYACRAWVNFNGTGTVAIRASGNVSSITDFGLGTYGINFQTSLPDGNYAVVGSSKIDPSATDHSPTDSWPAVSSQAPGSFTVSNTFHIAGAGYQAQDVALCSLAVYR